MKIPKANSVSLLSGIRFVFFENENNIAIIGSAFSGKESVYFNGQVVSEKRNLKKNSKHQFTINNDEYEIEFTVPEIMKGKIECSLYINGRVIKRYRTSCRRKFDPRIATIFAIIGAPIGFLLYIQKIPLWTVAIFILMAFVAGTLLKMNQIQIEEF